MFKILSELTEAHSWKNERLKGCKCKGPKDVTKSCPIHGVTDEFDNELDSYVDDLVRGLDAGDPKSADKFQSAISKKDPASFRKKVREDLNEGFSDFTVNGSDSAADLHAAALDAVEKHLRKGLKDKGNEYNTHGTLNVAMILIEKYKDELNEYGHFYDLAIEIMNKLNDEIKEQQKRDKDNNRISGDYLHAMQSFAKKLATATKSKR